MIRNHVAQSARRIIITTARFDADLFSDRNLHVIDIISVPDRLENAVAKAENQNILHGFLAEIMIDAENLIFLKDRAQFFIQSFSRFQIAPERFFKNETPPLFFIVFGKFNFIDLTNDFAEENRRRREIKEIITARVEFLFDIVENFFQLFE
jgi:hypothetical protein